MKKKKIIIYWSICLVSTRINSKQLNEIILIARRTKRKPEEISFDTLKTFVCCKMCVLMMVRGEKQAALAYKMQNFPKIKDGFNTRDHFVIIFLFFCPFSSIFHWNWRALVLFYTNSKIIMHNFLFLLFKGTNKKETHISSLSEWGKQNGNARPVFCQHLVILKFPYFSFYLLFILK